MDVTKPINLTGTIFICHQLCNLVFDILPQNGMNISNINNQISLQYNDNSRILFTGRGGQMERFIIKQINIIAPSIHKIDSSSSQMEVYIQCETEDSTMLLYVCALWNSGDNINDRGVQWKLVDKFANQLPGQNISNAPINNVITWSVLDLLPNNKSFYSFRTDPRTQFIVFTNPVIVPSQFYNNFINQIIGQQQYQQWQSIPIPTTAPENLTIFARNVDDTNTNDSNGDTADINTTPLPGNTANTTNNGSNTMGNTSGVEEKCPSDTGKVPTYALILWIFFAIILLIIGYFTGLITTPLMGILTALLLTILILIGYFVSIPIMVIALIGLSIFYIYRSDANSKIVQKVKDIGTSLAGLLLPGIAIMKQSVSNTKLSPKLNIPNIKNTLNSLKTKLNNLISKEDSNKDNNLFQQKVTVLRNINKQIEDLLDHLAETNSIYTKTLIEKLTNEIKEARKLNITDENYNAFLNELNNQLIQIDVELQNTTKILVSNNEGNQEPSSLLVSNNNSLPSFNSNIPITSNMSITNLLNSEFTNVENALEQQDLSKVKEEASQTSDKLIDIIKAVPAKLKQSFSKIQNLFSQTAQSDSLNKAQELLDEVNNEIKQLPIINEEEQKDILKRANEMRQEPPSLPASNAPETVYGSIPSQSLISKVNKGKRKNTNTKEKINKIDELSDAVNVLKDTIDKITNINNLNQYKNIINNYKKSIANATALNKSNKKYLSELLKLNNRLDNLIPERKEQIKNLLNAKFKGKILNMSNANIEKELKTYLSELETLTTNNIKDENKQRVYEILLDIMTKLEIARPGDVKYLTSNNWDKTKVISLINMIYNKLNEELNDNNLAISQMTEYINKITELLQLIQA